jgi:hypothetical protein
VALLRVMLPAGERRYLRDCGIATLPLAHLNAGLAPMGYVIVGRKTRSAERFVRCTDAYDQMERYRLFDLRRLEDEDDTEEGEAFATNKRQRLPHEGRGFAANRGR